MIPTTVVVVFSFLAWAEALPTSAAHDACTKLLRPLMKNPKKNMHAMKPALLTDSEVKVIEYANAMDMSIAPKATGDLFDHNLSERYPRDMLPTKAPTSKIVETLADSWVE